MTKLKKVLIVSPNFPPKNAPDHQRVRMSLPYFKDLGWDPYVISVRPEDSEGHYDPTIELTLKGVPFHHSVVGAVPRKYTRYLGLNTVGLRCLPTVYREGTRLIKKHKIDLVYFSTTVFPVTALGKFWKKKFGIPYIIDIQDPWLTDYYERTGTPPPGGKLKYAFATIIAKTLEPIAFKSADHFISTSKSYPKLYLKRYRNLRKKQFSVLTFGAAQKDFDTIEQEGLRHHIFEPSSPGKKFSYVGLLMPGHYFVLKALFEAAAKIRSEEPELVNDFSMHFVGTSYAYNGKAKSQTKAIACECGVEDMVFEKTERIPFLEALSLLRTSSCIMILGTDEPNYSASKLNPCLYADRKILAIFHQASNVGDIIKKVGAEEPINFNGSDDSTLNERVYNRLRDLLLDDCSPRVLDRNKLAPYSAEVMARKQVKIFEGVIANEKRQ